MADQFARSTRGPRDRRQWSLARRAWLKASGYTDADLERPLVGIITSYSEINHCNSHLRGLAEFVKRGVWATGGVPVEIPTISLFEFMVSPTTMLYRNLMAMDAEEMLRCHPLDSAVMLSNCDKTTPAYLMAAASADVPAILLTGGPMLNGAWRGQVLGGCSDCRRLSDEFRAGQVSEKQFREAEGELAPSAGHCMVMGTASTMACLSEALGMMLPGAAAIPAPLSARSRLAEMTGRRAVELAGEALRPSQILTARALENAVRVLMALGGSTNAVIHLVALAGRLGLELPLSEFDRLSRETPLVANLRPSGRFQMEDFYKAGGLPALLRELGDRLNLECMTVTGRTLGENVEAFDYVDPEVIRPCADPLQAEGGIAVLSGNLCPGGAIIKQSAASPELLAQRGRAVVFRSQDDLESRIDRPDLDVRPEDVLVLQNVGPKGGPGMPEWGQFAIPQKLLEAGVRDMVRISDARMSGTAYGTVVLHVSPESGVGGPLAVVRDGDEIELDVPNRRLTLHVADNEIERRLAQWQPAEPHYRRGYGWMFLQHILQADQGCDFDFCRADWETSRARANVSPRPSTGG